MTLSAWLWITIALGVLGLLFGWFNSEPRWSRIWPVLITIAVIILACIVSSGPVTGR